MSTERGNRGSVLVGVDAHLLRQWAVRTRYRSDGTVFGGSVWFIAAYSAEDAKRRVLEQIPTHAHHEIRVDPSDGSNNPYRLPHWPPSAAS